jgi:hypothetical protein
VDDKRIRNVASLSAMGPGTWFFDYPNHKIYLADDPTGHNVETSVTSVAFVDGPSDVTIRNLIVEKYANLAEIGAINAGPVRGWTVEGNEVRLNHGAGVAFGGVNLKVQSNNVHHNGEVGITGSGSDSVVEGNESAFNNEAGFDTAWGGGGTKFSFTENLTVRNNFVHNNIGPGLWTDTNNVNTVYEYNHTRGNKGGGIVHEISYRAVIRYNVVEDEPTSGPVGIWFGGGITVQNSADVAVYGNTVTNCGNGITALQANRGSNPQTGQPYLTKNFNVHDNTITQSAGEAAGIVSDPHAFGNQIFTAWNNQYAHNTYRLLDLSGQYFDWLNQARRKEDWQSFGNDVDGVFQVIP